MCWPSPSCAASPYFSALCAEFLGAAEACSPLRWGVSGGAAADPCFLPAEDKHGERRRPALLLPALHLRRGHGEHPPGVQRLPGHHPADAPAPVRTLVRGLTLEPVVLKSLLLTLSLDATPHRVEEYAIEMSLHFVYFNYLTLKLIRSEFGLVFLHAFWDCFCALF